MTEDISTYERAIINYIIQLLKVDLLLFLHITYVNYQNFAKLIEEYFGVIEKLFRLVTVKSLSLLWSRSSITSLHTRTTTKKRFGYENK